MSSFEFSPAPWVSNGTFAGIPVLIGYEIEVNADQRGRDVRIIPSVCVIGENGVDLCEDAGLFHPAQLKHRMAQAEADYAGVLASDSDPDDVDPWAAAEDRGNAQRVHHCGRTGR